MYEKNESTSIAAYTNIGTGMDPTNGEGKVASPPDRKVIRFKQMAKIEPSLYLTHGRVVVCIA